MQADRQAIRQFLERVHAGEPRGHLVVWTRPDRVTNAFDLGAAGAMDRAVECVAARAINLDVYAAVGLQLQRPQNQERGAEPGVISLPGLWADIDIQSPAHKTENLPHTEEAAMKLIKATGFKPSVLVRSGFGLQPYWLFKEPFIIETDQERVQLKSLSNRFQTYLRQRANAHGWTIDSTPDLCRVLRVPGTFNRKIETDIRPVTAEYHEAGYNITDFEELLSAIEDLSPAKSGCAEPCTLPPAKLPLIVQGCPWMRHCRDHAASLSEPCWYYMLTVLARCENPEFWAHELSRSYPRYTRIETQAKLRHASSATVAPVTCSYVQSNLNGGRFCKSCWFRGIVNSPIRIGRIDE